MSVLGKNQPTFEELSILDVEFKVGRKSCKRKLVKNIFLLDFELH